MTYTSILNTTTARNTYFPTAAAASTYLQTRLNPDPTPFVGASQQVQEEAMIAAFWAMEQLTWGGTLTRYQWTGGQQYAIGDEVWSPYPVGVGIFIRVEQAEAWFICNANHVSDSTTKPQQSANWSSCWSQMTYKSCWPRRGITARSSDYFDWKAIPYPVQWAQAEEALARIQRTLDPDHLERAERQRQGLTEFQMGDYREKYRGMAPPSLYGGQLYSPVAYKMIYGALATSAYRIQGL